MDFRYRINSKHDTRHQKIAEIFRQTVDLLDTDESGFVKCQVGYPAALEFNNWRDMELQPKALLPLMKFVKAQTGRGLSQTDFKIFGADYELWFCHDGGFHVSFVRKSPFVEKLFDMASGAKLIDSIERQLPDGESRVKPEGLRERQQGAWEEITFDECEE